MARNWNDNVPPEAVKRAAAKGLEQRKEFKRGGTLVGVARARNLSNGNAIPIATIARMVSYFARHAGDSNSADWDNSESPSAGRIAWNLWGGDAGKSWANRIWAAYKKERDN